MWARWHPAPAAEGDRARRELEKSEELLRRAQREVLIPLARMRDQNNVTELARRLLADGRGRRGGRAPGPAHGH